MRNICILIILLLISGCASHDVKIDLKKTASSLSKPIISTEIGSITSLPTPIRHSGQEEIKQSTTYSSIATEISNNSQIIRLDTLSPPSELVSLNISNLTLAQHTITNTDKMDSSIRYLDGVLFSKIGCSKITDIASGFNTKIGEDVVRPLDRLRTFNYGGYTIQLEPRIQEDLRGAYIQLSISY